MMPYPQNITPMVHIYVHLKALLMNAYSAHGIQKIMVDPMDIPMKVVQRKLEVDCYLLRDGMETFFFPTFK